MQSLVKGAGVSVVYGPYGVITHKFPSTFEICACDNTGILGRTDSRLYLLQNGQIAALSGHHHYSFLVNSRAYEVKIRISSVDAIDSDTGHIAFTTINPRSSIHLNTATLNGRTYVQVYDTEHITIVPELATVVDMTESSSDQIGSMCFSEMSSQTLYGALCIFRETVLTTLDTRCGNSAKVVYHSDPDSQTHRVDRICNMQGNIYIEQYPYDGTRMLFDERAMAIVGVPGVVPHTPFTTVNMFCHN